MSETWATTLLTVAIVVASGILGWLVNELRHFRTEFTRNIQTLYDKIGELNKTLHEYVTRKDCDIKMDDHCSQIEGLQGEVKENTKLLERIIQYHKTIGQPID